MWIVSLAGIVEDTLGPRRHPLPAFEDPCTSRVILLHIERGAQSDRAWY